MIYFARAKHMPAIVKPFLSTWWIEDEGLNRFIGLISGISGMIGSPVLIFAGLTGRKLLPFL